jgi:hypothetical protein
MTNTHNSEHSHSPPPRPSAPSAVKNREIFQRDPAIAKLLNDGVASVAEGMSAKEVETLRYELEHFVCEGQYLDGMVRILESYLGNIDSTVQRAAWVSGFFGSGKSHLLKMLRHLWVDTKFESDGAAARSLAHLPDSVQNLLRELDTQGKRRGGLHAASGTLPSGGGESVRLAVLSIVLRSKGLPEALPQARFCLWLKKNGIYDAVRTAVEDAGKEFAAELHDLYVSPLLGKAVLSADPEFAPDLKQARAALRTQFPVDEDISTADFIRLMREILTVDGEIPCTLIVLDEIQLYIGDSAQRSTDVQEVAEAICKQFDSRVLLIGSGQTALAGSVPLLQRLKGRFTIPVELSDTDVETVTRRVVLAKKADKRKAVEDAIQAHAGEIDRQLVGTRIGPRSEDRDVIVDDYPLLPVRRRFWEHALRAVDVPGTSSQLRTQLRIVHDSVRELADRPLGTVTSADFIFRQLQPDLLRTGVLLREIDETIRNLDDGTEEARLAQRLCGLVFLIRKLPREPVADIGVRATQEMLSDLLVEDLGKDGVRLRKEIPAVLDKLVADGTLIKLDEEYSLQTRESSEWDREFRNRQTRLSGDLTALSTKRTSLITGECSRVLNGIKILQGKGKEPRKLAVHFGAEAPEVTGHEIPVWVRDQWGEKDSTVLADARSAGSDSPIIFVFVKQQDPAGLKKAIIEYEAAKATLDFKGTPSTNEGREARDAMSTRMRGSEDTRNRIVRDVVGAAKVYQGGGNERFELDVVEKVRAAAEAGLDRMFPNFRDADDNRWPSVINRAKNGDEEALQAVDWKDTAEKHTVCARLMAEVGTGKRGKEIRDTFESAPYGWPRDAIDGALITLHTTGHLRTTHKGTALKIGQLDQAKVSMTDFRVETATIDTKQRIRLRKLFHSAGIACKSGEEAAKAEEFLDALMALALQAGGAPPLPACPGTGHIETLRALAGNEQLTEIHKQADSLEKQAEQWQEKAKLAADRKPAWETLERLLDHGASLPETVALKSQMEAVENERRLLDKTDPVPSIHKEITGTLRKALKVAHSELAKAHAREMKALESSGNWGKLTEAQKREILEAEGIAEVPALSISDDTALLKTLSATPLPVWKTKTDALAQQFSNAALAAARLLEPKAQSLKLTKATFHTESDADAWWDENRKQIIKKLKDGPVIIG